MHDEGRHSRRGTAGGNRDKGFVISTLYAKYLFSRQPQPLYVFFPIQSRRDESSALPSSISSDAIQSNAMATIPAESI